ncbi:MAG: tRNA adenylyltransferase [Phycisphaerales bacterium]|nr:MAG: tRNA adenylyltransferase [Phycisphaerales bacterium]
MPDRKLRKRIAIDAARMMYERTESEYYTAKRKAARQLGLDPRLRPRNLPSNREIREQIERLTAIHEGESRFANLREMRLAALRLMWRLAAFHPKLIGSAATGHVREGSDVDIHVFSDNAAAVTAILDEDRLVYTVERKRIIKHHQERLFTHVHVSDRSPRGAALQFELTVYPRDKVSYVFKSSITGKAIESLTVPQLERRIRDDYPDADLDALRDGDFAAWTDPIPVFKSLLERLEGVRQNPEYHPEGDALYHSLQAFDLARALRPYDEEFITAALLHDVGKAIDPRDHVAAAMEALEGLVTQRTAFLIENHMRALELKAGTLPVKIKSALQSSEWFEDLMDLRDVDDQARRTGVPVPTVDEALEFVRCLADGPE